MAQSAHLQPLPRRKPAHRHGVADPGVWSLHHDCTSRTLPISSRSGPDGEDTSAMECSGDSHLSALTGLVNCNVKKRSTSWNNMNGITSFTERLKTNKMRP